MDDDTWVWLIWVLSQGFGYVAALILLSFYINILIRLHELKKRTGPIWLIENLGQELVQTHNVSNFDRELRQAIRRGDLDIDEQEYDDLQRRLTERYTRDRTVAHETSPLRNTD